MRWKSHTHSLLFLWMPATWLCLERSVLLQEVSECEELGTYRKEVVGFLSIQSVSKFQSVRCSQLAHFSSQALKAWMDVLNRVKMKSLKEGKHALYNCLFQSSEVTPWCLVPPNIFFPNIKYLQPNILLTWHWQNNPSTTRNVWLSETL